MGDSSGVGGIGWRHCVFVFAASARAQTCGELLTRVFQLVPVYQGAVFGILSMSLRRSPRPCVVVQQDLLGGFFVWETLLPMYPFGGLTEELIDLGYYTTQKPVTNTKV